MRLARERAACDILLLVSYRDELLALERRIEELEKLVEERTRERDDLWSAKNLGPKAPRRFSRFMFHLGRAVGRALSRARPIAPDRALAAARQRARLLESRLVRLEEDIARARRELRGG
jgi:hypothetical protein